MTAACPGNAPSGPNGTTSNIVIFSTLALGSFLNNKGAAWAYAIAPFIGTLTFNLTDFCASDPPPMPVVTAADVASWFLPTNLHGLTDLRAAMSALVGNLLWYSVCQCNGVATPAGPAPTADPGGFTINPPTLTPGKAIDPCFHTTAEGISGSAGFNIFTWDQGSPLVIDVTTARLNWFWLPNGIGNVSTLQMYVLCIGQDGSQLAVRGPVNAESGNSGTLDFDVPLGTAHIDLQGTVGTTPNIEQFSYELSLFCNNAVPGGLIQPCCPPDPSLQLALAELQDLVRLIQRQAVPFATIHGAVHAGLTGDGEVAVSGLIGARVMPVTVPQWAGVAAGDPEQLWLDSWIAWGTADGFTERVWLRSAPFLSFAREAGQYTRIGYHLAGDLAVDLTEILREQ